ncbi:hypothetical protein PVAND_002095 [Polypedilum vanderplanki]|uniref:Uncharacterized protein n=1 Tax=Polypedilum vanderplanki TaxID=319348 RepID=A0A9J6BQ94_POLVA|nr:hypothetical protein PVAND_002095 [Polypedilum vanderplanki]
MLQSTEMGFKSIIAKNNHLFSRIFWLIAFITSIILLIYSSFWLIWKYNYEPDFGVKIIQRPMREIPFPAFTICSPVFAKNNLANYLKLGNIFNSKANFTIKEQNYFAANYQVCNPFDDIGDFQTVKDHVMNRTDFDIVKLLNESSMNVTELIHFCSISDELDCVKSFNQILTERGFCYNFNMQSNDLIYNDVINKKWKNLNFLKKIFNENSENDEKMTWTLDKGYSSKHRDNQNPYRATKHNRIGVYISLSHENANNPCPIVGKVFRVIFHLPNEIPTIFHNEHFVSYHYQKTFFLTATSYRSDKELRRYSPNIRGCYFQDERKLKFFKSYTKTQCDYECLTNYTLEICGCVRFSMPHEFNTPICDLDQMKCYSYVMLRWPQNNEENHIACNCLPTCNYIQYSLRYEKEAFIDYVKDLLGPEEKTKNTSDVVISVSFVEHLVMEHQRFLSYSFGNFIADIGGLLGLFLGASLVTFIEIIYMATQFIIRKIKKQQKVEVFDITNDAEMQAVKIQKLSQVVQILDFKQKESNVKITNLEARMEKLKGRNEQNDEIIKSLEEIIFKNRND